MAWKDLFATKSLELLHEEMKGENRLRRVLGPIGLTSLGVGAIIGAGIFVITGRVAANDAGPGVLLSYAVAGIACALAAFCYAEFASMAPVAGSAYTYAYATLGELFAWIIGWDLVLEYAMSAARRRGGVDELLQRVAQGSAHPGSPLVFMQRSVLNAGGLVQSPRGGDPVIVYDRPGDWHSRKCRVEHRPRAAQAGGRCFRHHRRHRIRQQRQLVRHSLRGAQDAGTNRVVRGGYGTRQRGGGAQPGSQGLCEGIHQGRPGIGYRHGQGPAGHELVAGDTGKEARADKEESRAETIKRQSLALLFSQLAANHQNTEHADYFAKLMTKHEPELPVTENDIAVAEAVLVKAREKAPELINDKWGMVGQIGINKTLEKVDDAARNNFMPYGISGVMVGAALVFFAFIGFDSISTHSEEAIKPQRDVPFGIIASLGICTVLYVAVCGDHHGHGAVSRNRRQSRGRRRRSPIEAAKDGSGMLNAAGGLIAAGALAGMTSVLLITFLSQARIFLAMARDGLVPQRVFGAVHEKFKTPHISTMITGSLMMVVAAFTPILKLEEMVNIGTLFAFVVVCSAVLILRIRRPEANRPFRAPLVYVVAPAGILVNLMLMFFLAPDTWIRLVVWLCIGLCIYFTFGIRHSILRRRHAAALGPVDPTAIQRLN